MRVFVAMPVTIDGRIAGAVYLSRTPNNIVKHLYGERGKCACVAAMSCWASRWSSAFVFGAHDQPADARADRPHASDRGRRRAARIRPLDSHGTREMAELSTAFLDMARKLQARSDTIRTFATHVSHELKSPLTAIQGAAELLRDADDDMEPAKRRASPTTSSPTPSG